MSSIYKAYRKDFLKFSIRYTSQTDIAIDAFQDAVIALYRNLLNDKITDNKASVKTYLFEIGKRKIFTALKKPNIDTQPLDNEVTNRNLNPYESQELEVTDSLKRAISKLGDTCQRLLVLYYYRRYSIESIVNSLGMKNENSVKANKSRCIKKLREILSNNNHA